MIERLFRELLAYFVGLNQALNDDARDDKVTTMTINAFTLDFRPQPDPPGWRPIVHPEGILYFYNEEKVRLSLSALFLL
jgi:hypothetical protein